MWIKNRCPLLQAVLTSNLILYSELIKRIAVHKIIQRECLFFFFLVNSYILQPFIIIPIEVQMTEY